MIPSGSKPSAALALACASCLTVPAARADTVHLKNGNTMEGLLVREDEQELELDIGYGTVVLPMTDVSRVERSSGLERKALQERQRERSFDAGRRVPPRARKFSARFQDIRSKREKALDAKERLQALAEEEAELEKALARRKKDFAPASDRLRRLSPDSAGTYNAAVHELNVLSSDIHADQIRLEQGRKEGEGLRKDIKGYLTAYEDFKRFLGSDGRFSGKETVGREEQDFYDGIRRSLEEMDQDLARESVASVKRGAHVVVDAVLDDRVKALLLVDTGASLTVISRRLADRLGPVSAVPAGGIIVSLADGRKVAAQAVKLDSVAVGKLRVAGVEAAVLPDSDPDVDGLLGMSFLRHFDVRIDGAENRLILTTLK